MCFCPGLFATGAEYSVFPVFAKMVFIRFSVSGDAMVDSKLLSAIQF